MKWIREESICLWGLRDEVVSLVAEPGIDLLGYINGDIVYFCYQYLSYVGFAAQSLYFQVGVIIFFEIPTRICYFNQ